MIAVTLRVQWAAGFMKVYLQIIPLKLKQLILKFEKVVSLITGFQLNTWTFLQ